MEVSSKLDLRGATCSQQTQNEFNTTTHRSHSAVWNSNGAFVGETGAGGGGSAGDIKGPPCNGHMAFHAPKREEKKGPRTQTFPTEVK